MTAVAPTPITFPRVDSYFEPVRVQRSAPTGPGPIADLVGADITTELDGSGRSVRYVNLDYAASAPALSAVAAEIAQALPQYASVHRGAGEQVDRIGGVAGEDDVVVGTGPDEPAHRDPRLLVPVGGELRQVSGATVDAVSYTHLTLPTKRIV